VLTWLYRGGWRKKQEKSLVRGRFRCWVDYWGHLMASGGLTVLTYCLVNDEKLPHFPFTDNFWIDIAFYSFIAVSFHSFIASMWYWYHNSYYQILI